jgi:hypothetical protein
VPGEDQELFVVRQQAARLGKECRVFAPVDRQNTLTALTARLAEQTLPPADPNPSLRARLVSAFILGSAVRTPEDADVGGVFAHVPVCRAKDQTGCVVASSSFRSTSPPPPDSSFGRVDGGKAACANPAAPGGGAAPLHPYFETSGQALPGGIGGWPRHRSG